MSLRLKTEPLTSVAFAPFGDVLEASGAPDKIINAGRCGRFHDRGALDFSDGRAGISIFRSDARSFPVTVDMMERHPDGSQAFVPMSADPFLVVVATDENGVPKDPRAFLTAPGQAVNFHRGTWHGVLTPLAAPGLFAVVDRIGSGPNLEEYIFQDPYMIDQES